MFVNMMELSLHLGHPGLPGDYPVPGFLYLRHYRTTQSLRAFERLIPQCWCFLVPFVCVYIWDAVITGYGLTCCAAMLTHKFLSLMQCKIPLAPQNFSEVCPAGSSLQGVVCNELRKIALSDCNTASPRWLLRPLKGEAGSGDQRWPGEMESPAHSLIWSPTENVRLFC